MKQNSNGTKGYMTKSVITFFLYPPSFSPEDNCPSSHINSFLQEVLVTYTTTVYTYCMHVHLYVYCIYTIGTFSTPDFCT